jgi:hypothetical protein
MKNTLVKRFLTLCLAVFAAIALQKFCHSKTDGFTDYKIFSNLSYHAQWNTPLSDEGEAAEILNQPFYYLAKGAQCYVFVSEDGNYVIKFFRLYHLQPPVWHSYLPLSSSIKQKKIQDKYADLVKDFDSYKIAYDELKEETGLVYLHLNKTDHLHKTLTLYDKIGVLHRIEADTTEFLIQKRADLLYPSLERLIESKQSELARQAVKDLVELLKVRCQKGIFDKDPDINTNFGFLHDKPVQIDIGRFRPDESRKDPAVYHPDIRRITDHLRQWLEQKDPSLSHYLEEQVASLERHEL